MLPLPPHWATSRPPGLSAACEPLEQALVVADPVEDGVREDGVDRLVELELGEALAQRTRRAARRGPRGRARPSRAPSRPPRRARAAAARAAARSRGPTPQPASSTVSSPSQRQPVEHRPRPSPPAASRRGRSWPRPSRARSCQRRGDRPAALALGLVARRSRRTAGASRRCRRGPRAGGARSPGRSRTAPGGPRTTPPAPRGRCGRGPAAISAFTSSSASTTGSSPILVQFE